jgi:hypothetical protein
MRNGVLMAEDSPQKIMESLGTNSLEEAFLKLSVMQESSVGLGNRIGGIELQPLKRKPSTSDKTDEVLVEKNKRRPKVMRALLVKNFTEVFRNFM